MTFSILIYILNFFKFSANFFFYVHSFFRGFKETKQKQSKRLSIVVSRSDMISKNVFTQLYGVVLFAYFEKSVLYCFIEKRSITFVLNNNGLNIET